MEKEKRFRSVETPLGMPQCPHLVNKNGAWARWRFADGLTPKAPGRALRLCY